MEKITRYVNNGGVAKENNGYPCSKVKCESLLNVIYGAGSIPAPTTLKLK